MEKVVTYIINLKHSVTRRKYMENLLSPYNFLDITFIDAISGRDCSERELKSKFNYEKSYGILGRDLLPSEVGCALSHRRCYETLLESGDEYALILEDDVSIITDLYNLDNYNLNQILKTEIPVILFLSGDYYYYRKSDIVSCYDAIGAYAYIINRAAAKTIVRNGKPFTVADYWDVYKRMGIKLKAVYPYMIDANLNMDLLSSEVNQTHWGFNRNNMFWQERLYSYIPAIVKKFLKLIGNYESKYHVLEGKVIGK